jgi:hypothetical protein
MVNAGLKESIKYGKYIESENYTAAKTFAVTGFKCCLFTYRS